MVEANMALKGVETVVRNLNRVVTRELSAASRAAEAGAQAILSDTLPHVPVLTGELRDSGYVRRSGRSSAEVGFSAEHAPFVHEIDRGHAHGEWKFLEHALQRQAAGLPLIFGSVMRVERF